MTTPETVAGLITVANGWKKVAANRLDLIETLRSELRKANHEVERLQGLPSNIEKVTRVVVVKDSGVVSETFAGTWDAYLQDDGRTLKLFGKGSGAEASAERSRSFAEDLRRYCIGCGTGYKGTHTCGRLGWEQ